VVPLPFVTLVLAAAPTGVESQLTIMTMMALHQAEEQ
jgi:hypothetical protein